MPNRLKVLNGSGDPSFFLLRGELYLDYSYGKVWIGLGTENRQVWTDKNDILDTRSESFRIGSLFGDVTICAEGVDLVSVTSGRVLVGDYVNGANLQVFGNVEAVQLVSNATNLPPLEVSSTLLVSNLNADLLDGYHASSFAPSSHTHTFLQLSDTPSSYSGQAGKYLRVNSSETGLEFASSAGGATTFLQLTDTPSSYANAGGYLVMVNTSQNGLVFNEKLNTNNLPSSGTWTLSNQLSVGNVLFINPSLSRVGINKSSPSEALEISGNLKLYSPSGELAVDRKITVEGIPTLELINTSNLVRSVVLTLGDAWTYLYTDNSFFEIKGSTQIDGILYLKVASSSVKLRNGALEPETGSQVSLGSSTNRWSGLFVSGVINSSVTGFPPLAVSSNMLVTNLNADLLDGQHASAFAPASHEHSAGDISTGILPISRGGTGNGTFVDGAVIVYNDLVGSFVSSYKLSFSSSPQTIPVSTTSGKLDESWITASDTFWLPSPPGVSGNYIVPYAIGSTAATTLALTASRTYWIPIGIPYQLTITTIAINVTTASAGTHYIGIYSSNSSGQPYMLIKSSSFDAGTTGVKTDTWNLVLKRGIYWLAWAAGSAATVRAVALAAVRTLGLLNLGTANTVCYYTSGSTLPTTAPTSGYTALTGSSLPAIGMLFTFSYP